MSDSLFREHIEAVVRQVLQRYLDDKNTKELRQIIVHEIYSRIPVGPAFQVICDSYNNGYEDTQAGRKNVDVYFNDEEDRLFCMEFVSDPYRDLTLDDAIKINAAYRSDDKTA